MATINYGKYIFSTTGSGALVIDGGWRQGAIVLADIDTVNPKSFSSAAQSPRVPAAEKEQLIALGNEYQTIVTQMKAADKAEWDAANPPPKVEDPVRESETLVATGTVSPEEKAAINSAVTRSLDEVATTEAGQTKQTPPSEDSKLERAPGGVLGGIPWMGSPAQLAQAQREQESNPEDELILASNILHEYPSYTYNLSLHALSADEYNKMTSNQVYTPTNVLIASAGRYNTVSEGSAAFKRNPIFADDFYFQNFTMKTVIGLHENSRDTNVVQIKFNIIEPYGVTLLNRIIETSMSLKIDNYLEMPYLIQLDFYGIDNAGNIVGIIPNASKRIPIRIIDLKIKVTERGAEYEIEASPYHHSAYYQHTVTTPVNLEIVASDVPSFFQQKTKEGFTELYKKNQERDNANMTGYVDANGNTVYVKAFAFDKSKGNSFSTAATYKVQSYASALNAWQNYLVETNKIGVADEYDFVFDPKILNNCQLEVMEKVNPKDTPMADVSNTRDIRRGSTTGEKTADISYKLKVESINAGTTIESVISRVIRNSEYILSQLVVPEDFGDGIDSLKKYQDAKKAIENEPLWWFRIVPELTLKEYDPIRKVFARKITYHVIAYQVKNLKVDFGPRAKASKPVKAYNYIYTGKNTDIINFDIQFNALYYTAITAYRSNLMTISGAADDAKQRKNPKGYLGGESFAGAVQPITYKAELGDSQTRATTQGASARAGAAADLQQSILTSRGGDMIQVLLTIVGDPAFIKQDDLYYKPNWDADKLNPNKVSLLTPNKSIVTDRGEVYVQLTFRTPIDIDETTGMAKFNSKYEQSVFSGMYKVLTVDSEFRAGKFTQQLTLVRLFDQPMFDYVSALRPKPNNNERNAALPDSTAPVTPDLATSTTDMPTQTSKADEPLPATTQAGTEQDTTPPAATKEQQDLANVAATAETQPITSATAPAATTMPPPPPPPLPNGVTIDPVSGNYVYKGVTFGGDLNAGIKAIDTKSTVTYSALDPVSGTMMTRTVDGAALVEAYSTTGQARSEYESKLADVQRIERNLAKDPTTYGTVAEGQQILEIRKAKLADAKAAYDATLK